MYQKLFLCLTACFLVSVECSTFTYNSLTRQLIRTGEEELKCTKEGLMCDSCTAVSECISIGVETYVKEPAFTCTGNSCSDTTGNCSSVPNPKCDENIKAFVLKCNRVGFFPHPFNRCKYYGCFPADDGNVNPVAKELNCEAGYAYDPYSGLCREKLADPKVCPMLIQPCLASSQRGRIPNHPSMYYICLKNANLIPLPNLYLCAGSMVYNETKKTCEEVVRNTGLTTAGKCLVRGFFYDPTSCFSYNECSAVVDSLPAKRLCPAKMYFDDKQAKCVDFTCAQAH